ncbi:hypothetical protein L1887_62172 [Cichorium endivia]|nr:hypothetical protein L1887_62172 [Cichorium endivia]
MSPINGVSTLATQPVQLWTSPDLVYGSDSDSDDSSDDDDNSDARSYSSVLELEAAPKGLLPRYGSVTSLKAPGALTGTATPVLAGGADTPRWIEDMKRAQTLPYVAPGFAADQRSSVYSHSLSGHKDIPSGSNSHDGNYDEVELVGDEHDVKGYSHSRESSYSGYPPVASSVGHSTHMTHDQLLGTQHLRNGSFSSERSGLAPTSMYDFQHEGTSRAGSVYEGYGSEAHEAFQRPQIIQWQQRDLNAADGEVGALAKPELGDAVGRKARDGTKGTVKPPESMVQAFVRRVNELLFIKGTTQLTSTGARRIDYLDGMRGFACFLVSFHHFMLIYYFGITTPNAPHHYPRFEFWFRSLIGPIVVNQGLKLGIFFMLPSRTMTNRGCPRLASRTWSTWSYWQNFDNVMVFLDAFISLWWSSPPVQPALVTGYATGVLWTIPVIVQGTWTCMICALIAHEIKNAYKRFSFYALCIGLSWYANTWDLFFMAGLVVADLDSKLNYQARAKKGLPHRSGLLATCSASAGEGGQAAGARPGVCLGALPGRLDSAVPLADPWLSWSGIRQQGVRAASGLVARAAACVGGEREHQLHGSACGVVGAVVFVLPADGSVGSAARLLPAACVVVHRSPRVLPVFLMHGVVWWTWSAWLCLTMLAAGAPYWATILVVFVTSYAMLMLVAECFTATFDYWGGLISKAVWRATLGWPGQEGLRLPYVLVSSPFRLCVVSLSLSLSLIL